MKRILLLVTVAFVMAAMAAAVAVPAFGVVTGTNPQGHGKDIVGSNCGNYDGDFYTVNEGIKGYVNHC